MRGGRRAALALAACAGLAPACGPPRDDPRPDVLWLTVDTLRADRLGFMGHGEAHTPNLDRLAREGTVFADAMTPVPRTTQAVASLLTSLYPDEHGVRKLGEPLADDLRTAPELFAERGYWTGAVSANGVAGPEQVGQGFRAFTDSATLKERYKVGRAGVRAGARRTGRAEATTREALRLLQEGSAPRFLWVHYMDPHFVYNPPPPWNRVVEWRRFTFYRDRLRKRPVQASTFFDLHGLTSANLPELLRLYDAEIAYADHWIGRLLAGLDRDTLVVFTSDHGESLGEHGYYLEHGDFVYQASMAVPLVFHWPGRVPAGLVVEEPVSILDVLPTVTALLGWETQAAWSGQDLSGRMQRQARQTLPDRVHFGESGEALLEGNPRRPKGGERWRMVRRGRFKLIRIPQDGGARYELYDLEKDPAETTDVSERRPEIAAALRALLEERLAKGAPVRDGPMPPDTREKLRELGYVE